MQRSVIVKLLVAFGAIQNDQRHSPESLPRNAPVRPFGNHGVNSFGAPFRRPFNFGNFRKRSRADGAASITAKAVEIDKPLFGGAKDHWSVAAPAMRIAVGNFLFAKQRTAIAQQPDDDGSRLENSFPFVFRQAFQISAMII